MRIKVAAIVALAFTLMGAGVSLLQYALMLLHVDQANWLRLALWPLGTVCHAVPIVALCVGLLTTDLRQAR